MLRYAVLIASALAICALDLAASAQDDDTRYEYRVVVPTTSGTQGWQVAESLERNVNRMAAAGFEVAAFVGGNSTVVSQLLGRGAPDAPSAASLGFVIMARPIGVPLRMREYRLLHASNSSTVGFDKFTAALKADGFRLATFAHEGGMFHAAFERSDSEPGVEYRFYANKSRNSWTKQLQEDEAALARLSRVVPVQLDLALVELGPETDSPGAVEWAPSTPAHRFPSAIEPFVNDKATQGYVVNLVRMRNNEVDVLLVKPAGGGNSSRTYDFDRGPWGSRCSRGAIAGADVHRDGDMYCAADTSDTTVANRGLDLTIRAYDSAGGALLFRPVSCEIQAHLRSPRNAGRRLAVAASLEQELNAKAMPGRRVTRALAADSNGQMRVYVVDSTVPPTTGAGSPVRGTPLPRLAADRDEVLGDRVRQHEDEINDALRQNAYLSRDTTVWVEIRDTGRDRGVRLAGCTSNRQDITVAEEAVKSLLFRTPYDGYAVRNEIILDRFR